MCTVAVGQDVWMHEGMVVRATHPTTSVEKELRCFSEVFGVYSKGSGGAVGFQAGE